ncbi:MAG: hypothetical protein H6563_14565 [Lewinellaceae bacterium]|nr:hypothetical protein [Lewinellaceae bacterium]
MRLLIPGLLVYALFVLFGRWYFVCEVRNRCADREVIPVRTPSLVLTEGEKIVLEGYEQFMFQPNSIRPVLSDENRRFLKDLSALLKENPSKQIMITGFYLRSEELIPTGFFKDIGLGRAAQIELMLEDMGVDPLRIAIHSMVLDRDTLEQPVRFLIPQTPTSTLLTE